MNDFEEMLSILNEYDVKYLVVGAHAVMLYTEPRYTKDLDIYIEASTENARNVFRAMAAFGAPLRGIAEQDFALPGLIYQMGVPPWRIDVINEISGVDFGSAWEARVSSKYRSVKANFMNRDFLIQNKLAVGRHTDLNDVEQLELSKKIRID